MAGKQDTPPAPDPEPTHTPDGKFAPGNQLGARNPPGQAPRFRVSYDPDRDPPMPSGASPHTKRSRAALSTAKTATPKTEVERRRRETVRLRIMGVPWEQIAKELGVSVSSVVKYERGWYDKEAINYNRPAEILRIANRYGQLFTMAMAEFTSYNNEKLKRLQANPNVDPRLIEAALNERAEFRAMMLTKIAHILAYEWRARTSIDVQQQASGAVPITPGAPSDVYNRIVAELDPAGRAELAARIRGVRELVPGISP